MTPKISLVAVCCSNDSLEFLKQPDVLDGDDRLIGEGLQKPDLLVRKRSDFRAPYQNRSDWNTLSQKWCADHGPGAVADSSRFGEWKLEPLIPLSCRGRVRLVCPPTALPATESRFKGVCVSEVLEIGP